MIKLRWLVKKNGQRVLQYKQQYDSNVYAGFPPDNIKPNLVWSDWMVVPDVVESETN